MSTSEKSAPPDRSYRWTTRKAEVFLGALADLGRVGEAARVVGMSRQSAYSLRARLGRDGLLARLWDKAQAEGREKRRVRARAARAKATSCRPKTTFSDSEGDIGAAPRRHSALKATISLCKTTGLAVKDDEKRHFGAGQCQRCQQPDDERQKR